MNLKQREKQLCKQGTSSFKKINEANKSAEPLPANRKDSSSLKGLNTDHDGSYSAEIDIANNNQQLYQQLNNPNLMKIVSAT